MPTPAPRVADVKRPLAVYCLLFTVCYLLKQRGRQEFFLVDGMIVTGVATGQPAELDEVNSVGGYFSFGPRSPPCSPHMHIFLSPSVTDNINIDV